MSDALKKAEAAIERAVDKVEAAVEDATGRYFGKDTLWHLAMGVAAVFGTLLLLAIAKHNIGAALAAASTLMGLAYEGQQKIRGEGAPSVLDAAATAAPGFLAWGALALFGLH